MPCGWGGNRRSGVALAMHHRLEWFIYLRAPGLRKDDEHGSWGMTLIVTFTTREHTHTHTRLTALRPGLYPGQPIPER